MRPVECLKAGDLVKRTGANALHVYVVDEVRGRDFDARRVMPNGGASRFSHTFRNDGELWRRVDAPWP